MLGLFCLFMRLLILGFIHLMYPKAVIIHIIRDPLDVMLSCFKHKFDDKGLCKYKK